MSSYPHKWRPLTEDEKIDESKLTVDNFQECAKTGGLLLPKVFSEKYAERIYNMEVYDDDIWIVTYPKCGTTWTQEIVWSMVHLMNDPNTDMKDKELFARTPFLEFPGIMPKYMRDKHEADTRPFEEKTLEAQCHGNTLEYVRTIKRPRVIKTHLPFSHLPQNLLEKAKVVYVCRGAKDQIVSYYHHMCLDDTVKMDVEEFARHMMKSRIHYGDYFAHLKEGWACRNHPNMKFVWYEEMQHDFDQYLSEMEIFLNCPLDDDQRAELKIRTKIGNMRKAAMDSTETAARKERLRKWYRKGQVGDSKQHFGNNLELDRELNKWIQENLRGTDIEYFKP